MAKEKKPHAETCGTPFAIKGTFEDIIKVAVQKKLLADKKEESKS